MFTEEPLPVPAERLVAPDLNRKIAAYLAPLRELTRMGVPACRFPAVLRELDAVPEMLLLLADRQQGFTAYEVLTGAGSGRAADAVAGLGRAGFPELRDMVGARLLAIRDTPAEERDAVAEAIDRRLTANERRMIDAWDPVAFAESAIARLCRVVKIEPLEGEDYRTAIRAYGARWGNDPHDTIVAALAEDRSVPGALARMYVRSMTLRALSDSGTRIRVLPAPRTTLSRLLKQAPEDLPPDVIQSRRIDTDLGVLHLMARVGERIEVLAELEEPGARRRSLMKLSRRAGPQAMAGIEADLRRLIQRGAA